MAIIITVNGNGGREGFLVAPSGTHEFPVPVGLKTDNGTTVQATLALTTGPGVNVQLSQTSVTIGPTLKSVKIVAKSPSKKQGDIRLDVKVGSTVRASYLLTSLPNPRLRFEGRFQARFATDGDFFNEPRGTSAGWTWALEGEPDFVPPANNIPTQPGMAVGRVVRFQNAVAPRPHVDPIGVKVTAVEANLGLKVVSFTSGDPVIGQQVSLGPDSYLAANEPIPPGPQPFETYQAGFEPIENFELHIGSVFSAKPAALTDRPKAGGFFPLTPAEITKYGIVSLNTFNSQRKAALLSDYHALSPADRTGTPAGRNLAKRISHLGGSAPDNIPPTQGTLPLGWTGKETYTGILNNSIQITPGKSAVLAYFKVFTQFRYTGTLFNFHSDEQCGRVDASLAAFTATLQRAFEPNA